MPPESPLSTEELAAGLNEIHKSPRTSGVVEWIVRRPGPGERDVVAVAELDVVEGLVGDDWLRRGSRMTSDGSAHPDMQLTVMNSRAIALVARSKDRWQLAGDQLYVDLDLSTDNLPPGTRLRVGTATIEVTREPHTGCKQFSAHFGIAATKFVNSTEGKRLRLRGINAMVVQSGTVRVGELATKLETDP